MDTTNYPGKEYRERQRLNKLKKNEPWIFKDGQRKSEVDIFNIPKCEIAEECKNNRCVFRQRQVFGSNPFCHIPEIVEKYGMEIYPNLRGIPGTNQVVIYCQDSDKYNEVKV